MEIVLTPDEVSAVYDLIDTLSGGNASNVFSWDNHDDIKDPTISAMVKIFVAVGAEIPKKLKQSR